MNENYLNQLAMNYDPFPLLKQLQSQPQVPLGVDPNFIPLTQPVQPGQTDPTKAGMPQATPLSPDTMARLAAMMPQQGGEAPRPAPAASPRQGGPINVAASLNQMPTMPAVYAPKGVPSLAKFLGMS